MYIYRHNRALQEVAQTIRKSHWGGSLLRIDSGKETTESNPRWTVHKNLLAKPPIVSKSIIDLTMTRGVSHEDEIETDKTYNIHMLEGTYTSGNTQRALENKEETYAPLRSTLRKNKHNVETSYMILNTMIPFMHNEGAESFLYQFFDKDFPISNEEIERIEAKIWKITVNSLAEIARMYWKLLPPPSSTRNPNDNNRHPRSSHKSAKG